MRYSLRNKKKIAAAFDDKFLKRLILSLDEAFKENILNVYDEYKPYPILTINDEGHTCGLILFYVISEKFDVCNLAFKEIVN